MINGVPPPVRTPLERELERLQRKVTEGRLADERRRRMIAEMYQAGMSQVELSARLSRAPRAVGGGDIGVDAVWNICKRWRYR